jgi:hypothetical protein
VLPLLLSEFTDWCPWLAARLVGRAARLLPAPDRTRYQEEWLAELHEVPGRLAKLAVAASLLCGAVRMRAILRRSGRAAWTWRRRFAVLRWLLAPRGMALSVTVHGRLGNGAPLALTLTMPPERRPRARWANLRLISGVRMLAEMATRLPDEAAWTQVTQATLASAAKVDGLTVTWNTDAAPGNQHGSATPDLPQL